MVFGRPKLFLLQPKDIYVVWINQKVRNVGTFVYVQTKKRNTSLMTLLYGIGIRNWDIQHEYEFILLSDFDFKSYENGKYRENQKVNFLLEF